VVQEESEDTSFRDHGQYWAFIQENQELMDKVGFCLSSYEIVMGI
jgi:hypothetical protein